MIKDGSHKYQPERPCKSRLSFEFASKFSPYSFKAPSNAPKVLFVVPRGMVYDLALMGVISLRLRLEGRESHFILCDNLPMCSQRDIRNDARNICDRCLETNTDFLAFNGFDYSTIWAYLDANDVVEAREIAANITLDSLDDLKYSGLDIGRLQDIAVSRYFFRGSPESNEKGEKIAREFIYSAILLSKSFERVIDKLQPEMLVIPNGKTSWASIANAIAGRAGIRTISFGDYGLSASCGFGRVWDFSSEGPAVDFRLIKAWDNWKDIPLTDEENVALDLHLERRKKGSRYYPDPKDDLAEIEKELGIKIKPPVVTLYSNVVWDTAVLQKHVVFSSMFEWIEETIHAAEGQPYTLLIRTHPAEKGVDGFISRQKVADEIHRKFEKLPDNVKVISTESRISSYTLLNISDVSLVYTSTVGLETALSGKTAVVSSIPHYSRRGFTVDVTSRDEYRSYLNDISSIPRVTSDQTELARRYCYMFFFRNHIPLQFFGTHSQWNVSHYRIESVEDIMPGNNPYLDLVIDGIVNDGDFTIPRELNYFEGVLPQRIHNPLPIVRESKALLKLDMIFRETLDADPNNQAALQEMRQLEPSFAPASDIDKSGIVGMLEAAQISLKNGKIDEAVERWEEVLRFDPNNDDALVGLGRILLDFGHVDDAEMMLLRAVRVCPKNNLAWQWLLNVYKSRNNMQALGQKVQEWLMHQPDHIPALIQAAAMILEFGDTRSQKELLERVCCLGSDPAAEAMLSSLGLPVPAIEKVDDDSQPVDISVLLCSYNRADTLKKCLETLEKQTLDRDRFEVVCVNDGSTDHTREVMQDALQRLPGTYHEHETNKALAAARNTAIRAAKGKLVLFINDDTYPEPDMLEQHILTHEKLGGGKITVLGYISFAPDQAERTMSRAMHNFNLLFPLIGTQEGVEYGFDYFVTGNLSVPREAFIDEDVWFDETFLRYGCEDIEVGYRLWKAGYRMYHQPAARAIHDHLMAVRDYERREGANSANLVQFVDKHPELLPHYLEVPQLTESVLSEWGQQVEQFDPQLPRMIDQLTSVEDTTSADLGDRTDEITNLMGEGLKLISRHVKHKTILQTLEDLPDARRRLVKNDRHVILNDENGSGEVSQTGTPGTVNESGKRSETERCTSPLLTVIVPCYNAEKTVAETLESILLSEYHPLEVIAVDDGSNDGTLAVLKSFSDRITVLTRENDGFKGPGGAINQALAVAKGEYIHCLDSDDTVLPDYHSKAIAEMEQDKQIAAVCANAIRVDNHGRELGPFRLSNFKSEDNFRLEALVHNPIISSTMIVRKDAYDRAGYRRPEYEICDDYELWLRISEVGLIHHLDRVGIYYRDAGEGISTDLERTHKHDVMIVGEYLNRHKLEYFFSLLNDAKQPELIANGHAHIAEILLNRKMEDLARTEAEKAKALYPDNPKAAEIMRFLDLNTTVISSVKGTSNDDRLKLLLVAHNFPPYSFAGSEIYIHNISQALQTLDVNVQVVHPCNDTFDETQKVKFEIYDGIPVHRIQSPHVRGGIFLHCDELTQQLSNIIGGFNPDIIHFQHMMDWHADLLPFISKLTTPTLLTLHDFFMMCPMIHLLKPDHRTICSGPKSTGTCDECINSISDPSKPQDWDLVHSFIDTRLNLFRVGYRSVDRVLAPSRYLMDIYSDNGFHNPDTLQWRFGLRLFQQLPKRKSNGKVRFIYIGNLTRLKGITDLVKAFRKISPDNAELSIWGNEFTGQLEKEFHEIADPLPHVFQKGPYKPDDLPRILTDGDIVVVPSHIENYPLVVREALHAGLPVIASRVGGIPEIVEENVTGLLFTPGDVNDIADKLQQVIDQPHLIDELTANIKPVRSIEDDARDHMELYRDLLQETTEEDHVEQLIESARKLAMRGLKKAATKRIERALQDNPEENRLKECLAEITQD